MFLSVHQSRLTPFDEVRTKVRYSIAIKTSNNSVLDRALQLHVYAFINVAFC